MKIFNVDFYFDGGTAIIDTDDECMYYVDRRLDSNTHGCIYKCAYPDEECSILANDVKDELLFALESHKDEMYQEAINHLILDIKNSN